MRTDFTTNFAAALAEKELQPVVIASFDFDTDGTVEIATESITIGGTTYSGIIASIGKAENINDTGPFGINIPALTIRVVNSAATPFSDYFKDNNPRKTTVTIKTWMKGKDLLPADITEIDRYYVETPVYNELYCEMRLINPLYRANKRIGRRLNRTDYPGLDPDYIGRMPNIIYGDVKEVRCIPVDAGAATTLCTPGGIDAIQTTGIYISQGLRDTEFPDDGSPAKLYIENEEIWYTTVDKQDGYWELTGTVQRGKNGTTAVAHPYSSATFSVSNLDGTDRSNYIWLVADHAIKSIGAVYVDGIMQVGGYTAYTGQSGDEHPSGDYDGKAVIDFDAKPTIDKQVNINIIDGVSVNDGTDVSDPGHDHTTYIHESFYEGTGGNTNLTSFTVTGNVVNVYNGSDQYADGIIHVESATGGVTGNFLVTFPAWTGATPTSVKIKMRYKWATSDASAPDANTYLRLGGNGAGSGTDMSISTTAGGFAAAAYVLGTHDNSTTAPTTVHVSLNVAGSESYYLEVTEVWLDIIANAVTSGTAGVTKTGSVTKDGTVSLDPSNNATADLVIGTKITTNVQGYQDDGAGTWTGVAEALITRPADVMRHFAEVYSTAASGIDWTKQTFQPGFGTAANQWWKDTEWGPLGQVPLAGGIVTTLSSITAPSPLPYTGAGAISDYIAIDASLGYTLFYYYCFFAPAPFEAYAAAYVECFDEDKVSLGLATKSPYTTGVHTAIECIDDLTLHSNSVAFTSAHWPTGTVYVRIWVGGVGDATHPGGSTVVFNTGVQFYATTGPGPNLVYNPSMIFNEVVTDPTSFAAARTLEAADSLLFAGVLRNDEMYMDVLTRMMNQARARLWYSRGYLRMKHIPDTPTAGYGLTKSDIVLQSILIMPTGKPELVNSAQINYDAFWGTLADEPGKFYGLTDLATDADSITANGTCDLDISLAYCEWLNDATTAEDLRDYFVARFKDVNDRIPVTLRWGLLKVEESDFVSLTHAAAAYGYDATKVFIVEGPPVPVFGALAEEGTVPYGIQIRLLEV